MSTQPPYTFSPGFFKGLEDSDPAFKDIEGCLASFAAYCGFMTHEILAVQRFGCMPPDQPWLYKEAGKDFAKYCTSQQYYVEVPQTFSIIGGIAHADGENTQWRSILDQEMMWNSGLFEKLHNTLRNFWVEGELTPLTAWQESDLTVLETPWYNFESLDTRLWIFLRVALHDGWSTLQLLQPGGLERGQVRLEQAKRDVLALTEEQLQRARERYRRGEGWTYHKRDLRP